MTRSVLYHSTLDANFREIRLLDLQPATWESPIQCTLTNVSLNDSPVYSALSYVWGDPKATTNIHIEDSVIPITQNLESALRHIRPSSKHLLIWIDALCINQANIPERNQQVSIMSDIYTTASQVLIWIGKADDLSDIAFDSMSTTAQGHIDSTARTTVCSFYLSLQHRPWFSRVWIIQELALATNDPIVICGHKSAPWSIFIAAWNTLSGPLFKELGMTTRVNSNNVDADGEQSEEVKASIKIELLNDIRTSRTSGKTHTFRQLYLISRTSESTEPRDRVYGLLEMLSAEDRAKFSIDYGKPVSIVFAEAMAHVFEKGEGPFLLSGMWLHAGRSEIPDLPTWVPDFAAQTAEKAKYPGGAAFHPPSPLTVSGAGAGAKNGGVRGDVKTLAVEAVLVDEVRITHQFGQTLEESIEKFGMLEGLIARVREEKMLDVVLAPYYEKFRSSEPLWSVLVCGKKHMSGYDQAPESYGRTYAKLCGNGDQWSVCDGDERSNGENVDAEYRSCLSNNLPDRTFFITSNGFIGIGGSGIQSGDRVTIWFGAPTAFVVRSCGADTKERCSLISAAYVGGIMNGEIVDELYCEDLLDSRTLFVV